MKYPLLKTLPASALSLLLVACGGGSDSFKGNNRFSYDASAMIDNLVNQVIVAGYADLDNKGQDLWTAVGTLDSTPTQANLSAAQNAWKAARQPWEQGEAHIFGPVDSLEIDPHLDSWPLDTTELASMVAATAQHNADAIKAASDSVQGFHAMEYLLFSNGSPKTIANLTNNERTYLVALAQVFESYTASLHTSWSLHHDLDNLASEPYKNFLLDPDNIFYNSELAVMEEFIDGMIGIVDEVGNGKIADPFGSSISQADASKEESQYSWNSIADFSNNIKGVQNMYRGEFSGTADKPGIIDFVNAADPVLAQRVDDEIADAIAKIIAIGDSNNDSVADMSFHDAISNTQGRQRIETAIAALSTLQITLTDDVKPLLNRWQN